jgi:hypothetical protein
VENLAVDVVNVMQFGKSDATCCAYKVGSSRASVSVADGNDDYVGEMNEVCASRLSAAPVGKHVETDLLWRRGCQKLLPS